MEQEKGSPRSIFPSGELEVINKGMGEMMKNMLTFQKQMLANFQTFEKGSPQSLCNPKAMQSGMAKTIEFLRRRSRKNLHFALSFVSTLKYGF